MYRFLSRDWDIDFDDEDFNVKIMSKAAQVKSLDRSFYYDWDYSIPEQENYIAMKKAMEHRDAEVMPAEGYDRDSVLEDKRKLLTIQLLLPFFIRKALREVNACGVEDPAGKSQNTFIVQV